MSYIEINRNLFNSKTQVNVNTVNYFSGMDKSVALEFHRRYPKMLFEHKMVCVSRTLLPGWIYE